jgi:glucokinase
MMNSPYFIGVDIGGTKIATGLATLDGQVIRRIVLPTPIDQPAEVVVEQIFNAIETVLDAEAIPPPHGGHMLEAIRIAELGGIGVVAPGPLNPRTGELLYSPNLPAVQNLPLGRLIAERYRCPVRVENDANAAGLAEARYGAGVGYRFVFYVTVSTGIGTGVVLDGQIYNGSRGFAAEGGHVTINHLGPPCSCGHNGCIEAYASGTGLARRTKAILRTLGRESLTPTYGLRILDLADGDSDQVTAKIIADAARQGDRLAREVIDETAHYLSIWLGGMINLFDPDIIIIGGGMSTLGDLLFRPIRELTPRYAILPSAGTIPIVPARLGHDVGILGAVALFAADGPSQAI